MKSRIILSTFTLLIMGLLFAYGCKTIVGTEYDQDVIKNLINKEWEIKGFINSMGIEEDVGTQGILLYFNENGKFWGRSYNFKDGKERGGPGSNFYNGKYVLLKNFRILFDSVTVTEVNAPSGSRFYDFAYNIRKINKFKIEGNDLWLYYDNPTKAFHFVASSIKQDD
ncbi:MAG: hypothetical protein GXO78_12620 [Calditrichaeota bacterium]|nr:hypothetical protein [Calditrichota bacterium]